MVPEKDAKEKSIKSTVTGKIVETDHLTYARVNSDQFCDTPLVPMKHPTKQMNWDITLGKAVVYNPPKRCGIFGNTIYCGYGSKINGGLYGRSEVVLESGRSEKLGDGLIYGSVASNGTVTVKSPSRSQYLEGEIMIVGDIVAKRVNIDAPVKILGNIIAQGPIDMNAPSIVHGVIYSKTDRIVVQKTTAAALIAGNSRLKNHIQALSRSGEKLQLALLKELETRRSFETILERLQRRQDLEVVSSEIYKALIELKQSSFIREYTSLSNPERSDWELCHGIEIGEGVSLFNPTALVLNGQSGFQSPLIAVKKDVRLLSAYCSQCPNEKNPIHCDPFNEGRCNLYTRMDQGDLLLLGMGAVLTTAWRQSSAVTDFLANVFAMIKKNLLWRKKESQYKQLFATISADKGLGDGEKKVKQELFFDQRQEYVMGDKVGTGATLVKESVLQRSSIGQGGTDTDSGGDSVEVKNSVLQRSKISDQQRKNGRARSEVTIEDSVLQRSQIDIEDEIEWKLTPQKANIQDSTLQHGHIGAHEKAEERNEWSEMADPIVLEKIYDEEVDDHED